MFVNLIIFVAFAVVASAENLESNGGDVGRYPTIPQRGLRPIQYTDAPVVWPQPTSLSYKSSRGVFDISKASLEFNSMESNLTNPVQRKKFPDAVVMTVSSEAQFVTKGGSNPTLDSLYKRYSKIMFPHATSTQNPADVTTIQVNVDDKSEAFPDLDTDESYTITSTSTGSSDSSANIFISSKTVYGAIRAVETLSQLVVYSFDDAVYTVPQQLSVKDSPRFAHRGMLLDTARHYQPMGYLRHMVDALSFAKYNVLHWHVVDTQSFPFQSMSSPALWEGSYTPRERYTRADMASLVEYARLRGVRVMIEFDTPGHAASWCTGYPEICPSATCQQPLNPASPKTLPVINGLIDECARPMKGEGAGGALFPYSMIHLGGDEVDYKCWERSDEIQAWQKENNIDGSEGTYEYFVNAVGEMARDAKRLPVQWEEVFVHFGANLDKSSVVHVWKDKTTLNNALKLGYRALLSNQDDWYLDHEWTSWETMYNNEPTDGLDKDVDISLLLGGETCMWGENVDPSDLDSTVWPRAAAAAERLWTQKEVIDSHKIDWVEPRLQMFRCLLQTRGVGAAPLHNKHARTMPPQPGSCYQQRRLTETPL